MQFGTERKYREMAILVKVEKYYINPESVTVVYPAFNTTDKTEMCEIHFVSGQPLTVSVSADTLASLINRG
jgi:hypothetical protein